MLLPITAIWIATVLITVRSSPIPANEDLSMHSSSQTALNVCPQLSVKCVAEGDWMHPIGHLGKRRKQLGPPSIQVDENRAD
jgi:hypothetical protein